MPTKRYDLMTEQDKLEFYEQAKKAFRKKYHLPWSIIEPKIRAEYEATFDDEKFLKLSPDSQIDTAYARRDFSNWREKKPDFIDYFIWQGRFVAQNDYLTW